MAAGALAGVDRAGVLLKTSLFSASGPERDSGHKHAIPAVCLGQTGWEQNHGFPMDKMGFLSWGHSSLRDFSGWISREADGGMQVKLVSNAVSCQVVSCKSDLF